MLPSTFAALCLRAQQHQPPPNTTTTPTTSRYVQTLIVGCHPTLDSWFTAADVGSGQAVSLLGGAGADSFVVDLPSIAGGLEVAGAGGVNNFVAHIGAMPGAASASTVSVASASTVSVRANGDSSSGGAVVQFSNVQQQRYVVVASPGSANAFVLVSPDPDTLIQVDSVGAVGSATTHQVTGCSGECGWFSGWWWSTYCKGQCSVRICLPACLVVLLLLVRGVFGLAAYVRDRVYRQMLYVPVPTMPYVPLIPSCAGGADIRFTLSGGGEHVVNLGSAGSLAAFGCTMRVVGSDVGDQVDRVVVSADAEARPLHWKLYDNYLSVHDSTGNGGSFTVCVGERETESPRSPCLCSRWLLVMCCCVRVFYG